MLYDPDGNSAKARGGPISHYATAHPGEMVRQSEVTFKPQQESVRQVLPGENNQPGGLRRPVGSCSTKTTRVFSCDMLVSIISLAVTLLSLKGPPNSLTSKGNVCLQGGPGQMPTQDFAHLQAEAEGGNAAAQLKLARAYESGAGVSQDDQLASLWYRRAAEQGSSEAQDTMGSRYLIGQGLQQNKEEAVNWFRKSARQGNANAMYHLGVAYYNGDGVAVDAAYPTLGLSWQVKLAIKAPRRPQKEPRRN